MPLWILTSRALSNRYSKNLKKFAAKFLVLVSKSEFWFYDQRKVAYLLSAPLNQDLSLSFYFLFVYQTVLCSQSCTIPIAEANDRLSVLIVLPTFSRAYESFTCFGMLSVLMGEIPMD